MFRALVPVPAKAPVVPPSTPEGRSGDPTLMPAASLMDLCGPPTGRSLRSTFRARAQGPGQGTTAQNLNPAGDIAGYYVDAANVFHGFLRTKHGAITTFDVPGAGTSAGQGTIPISNNAADTITGYYIDSIGVYHGFLRTAH